MVVVLITMVSTVQIETYIMLCAAKFTQHVIGARRPATHPLLRTRDTMLDIRSRAPIASNKSALIKEKWKHALNL